jgi:F-type H+-transporting ATPase subunit gamma
MANLKEIRSRISSVKSTMQITSAMKMVSAAKLKKAQDAIIQMRPYSEKLTEILGNLGPALEQADSPYAKVRPAEKVLLVMITSNRGLCGGFNANVIKKVKELKETVYADADVTLMGVGKKGMDFYKRLSEPMWGSNTNVWDDLHYDHSSEIAESIMEAYTAGKYDKVEIVYNSFKNAATQVLKNETFLPIQVPEENSGNTDYIFEPSEVEILEHLVPQSLKTQFFKALLDSHAAEHGARMTAMHKATDNANELKKDLTLTYNKARQAAITNEILEIVSGAEALSAS